MPSTLPARAEDSDEVAVAENDFPEGRRQLREVVVNEQQRKAEAPCSRERCFEPATERRSVKQMEELVGGQEVLSLSPKARIRRLEEELCYEAPENLHLFFGRARALAKKHHQDLPVIEDSAKIEEVVGPKHEPDVLWKEQPVEPAEQSVFRHLRDSRPGAEKEVLDCRIGATACQHSADEFVLKDFWGLHEAQASLREENQQVPEDVLHVKPEGGIEEAPEGERHFIGLNVSRDAGDRTADVEGHQVVAERVDHDQTLAEPRGVSRRELPRGDRDQAQHGVIEIAFAVDHAERSAGFQCLAQDFRDPGRLACSRPPLHEPVRGGRRPRQPDRDLLACRGSCSAEKEPIGQVSSRSNESIVVGERLMKLSARRFPDGL